MSRRRGAAGAGGGGPLPGPAPPHGGAAWRRQQELAELAAAVRQLPAADALPAALLRGLGRALLAVRHVCDGAGGEACMEGELAAQEGAEEAGAQEGEGDQPAAAGAAEAESEGRECRLAEMLAGQLRGLLDSVAPPQAPGAPGAAETDSEQLGRGAVDGGGAHSGAWDSRVYAHALLHHFTLLSTDLLDGLSGGGGSTPAWACRRDTLAAAPLGLGSLPLGVYGRLVGHMRWRGQLLELLGWRAGADPRAAAACLARLLRACPALAPWFASLAQRERDGVPAGHCGVRRDAVSSRAVALLTADGPLAAVAAAVRQAAAAGAAAGGGAGAADGAEWLPCLLLLARGLAARLRAQAARGSRPGAAPAAAAGGGRGEPGAGAGAACDVEAGTASAATECCEALQEGLCAWQAALTAGAAAAAGAAAGGGQARAACDLMRLMRTQLQPALDALAAAAAQRQDAAAAAALLPYASVVRLRGRLALLFMFAGHSAAGAEAAVEEQLVQEEGEAGSQERRDAGQRPTGGDPAVRLDPWDGLTAPAPAAAAPWRRDEARPLPDWLAAATGPAAEGRAQGLPPPHTPTALLLRVLGRHAGKASRDAASGERIAHGAPVHDTVAPAANNALAAAGQHSAAGGGAEDDAPERLAALVVALLTPGTASWLAAQADPRVAAAAGPDPYSPFRVALALLELLQGQVSRRAGGGGNACGEPAAVGKAGEAGGEVAAAGGAQRPVPAHSDRLPALLLRLAAQCLACVEGAGQQAALQAVVGAGSGFGSLRRWLSASPSLHASAAAALVALSNRTAAAEGSLDRVALGPAAEAARLAAAAAALLPYALLAPAAALDRLLADGLLHSGQLPWVLQLLRCFATLAAAPAPADLTAPQEPTAGSESAPLEARRQAVAGGGGGEGVEEVEGEAAAGPPSLMLACLWTALRQHGPELLAAAAGRRALGAMAAGLAAAEVAAPRGILAAVVAPALEAGARGGAGGAEACQAHCALIVAQHLLAHPAAAAAAAPLPYSPAAELAAARPAALLLAAAALLDGHIMQYSAVRRLDAAALDATAGLLERGVVLYGGHLAGGRPAGRGGGGEAEAREVGALLAGSGRLSTRVALMLLPLLEQPPARPGPAGAEPAEADGGAEEEGEDDGRTAARRALAARLVPPALWRPRSLRAADPRVAQQAAYDALCLAASGPAHAAALRSALLQEAAEREEEERLEEEAGAQRGTGVGTAGSGGAAEPELDPWAGWGAADESTAAGAGPLARHLAAAAARGLPQLPLPALAAGCVAALAALLPTATADQAGRVLGALPAVVRAAGGAAGWAAELGRVGAAGSVCDGGGGGGGGGAAVAGVAMAILLEDAERRRHDGRGAVGVAAADVAVAGVVACRAAAAAVLAASSAGEGGGGDGGRGAEPVSAPAPSLQAVSDRGAGHVAGLVGAMGALSGAALGPARRRKGGLPSPRAGALPCAAAAACLLEEAAGAVAAVAAAGLTVAGEVWKAAMLAAAEQLVGALAAALEGTGPAAEAAEAGGSGGAAADPPALAAARGLLRGVRAALAAMPGGAGAAVWGAAERLCEEAGGGLAALAAEAGAEAGGAAEAGAGV